MKKTEKMISYETPEVEIVDCGSESAYCDAGGAMSNLEEGEAW